MHKPTTSYDPTLPSNTMGQIDIYGNISLQPGMSATDEALTLAHEQVHSSLSPKVMLLRDFRAKLRMTAYEESQLLRYVEEALAETVANIKVKGFSITAVVEGLKFPIVGKYVTLSRVLTQGPIGTIVYAGVVYAVFVMTDGTANDKKEGRNMSRDEAIDRARNYAMERQWPWKDPLRVWVSRRWFVGRKQWTVVESANTLGGTRIVIDDQTGSILEGGFLPR